jgi:probable F420-dependent oxidoreductase
VSSKDRLSPHRLEDGRRYERLSAWVDQVDGGSCPDHARPVAMARDPRQRPFRFGVLALGGPDASASQWTDLARRAEGEGCSTLLVGDHYVLPTACTVRLTMAAAGTTTLRLGSCVYCNDFRHPALLAKEAAELDRLSSGRFELGLGAGWIKEECDAIGLSFDEGRVGADRFQEAVGIIRRLLAGETVTHLGDHYTLNEYTPAALPIQQPVPMFLGGGGPRMTRFAAQHADIIGFDPMSLPEGGKNQREFGGPAFEEKLRILDDVSAARDDGGPERSILLFDVARRAEDVPDDSWVDQQQAHHSPYALFGDTSAMVDTLVERRDRWGLTYTVFAEEDFDVFSPVMAALGGT